MFAAHKYSQVDSLKCLSNVKSQLCGLYDSFWLEFANFLTHSQSGFLQAVCKKNPVHRQFAWHSAYLFLYTYKSVCTYREDSNEARLEVPRKGKNYSRLAVL